MIPFLCYRVHNATFCECNYCFPMGDVVPSISIRCRSRRNITVATIQKFWQIAEISFGRRKKRRWLLDQYDTFYSNRALSISQFTSFSDTLFFIKGSTAGESNLSVSSFVRIRNGFMKKIEKHCSALTLQSQSRGSDKKFITYEN